MTDISASTSPAGPPPVESHEDSPGAGEHAPAPLPRCMTSSASSYAQA